MTTTNDPVPTNDPVDYRCRKCGHGFGIGEAAFTLETSCGSDDLETPSVSVPTETAAAGLRKIVRDDELGRREVIVYPNGAEDDPGLDGTDAAHPAWWRGNGAGIDAVVRIVNNLLDGVPSAGAFGYEPLQQMFERLSAVRHAATRPAPDLDAVMTEIQKEVSFRLFPLPDYGPQNPYQRGREDAKLTAIKVVCEVVPTILTKHFGGHP